MSVWDGQREAMRLMMPVLMRKKQMEREDEQKRVELEAAAAQLEQERADKAAEIQREKDKAELKWRQDLYSQQTKDGNIGGLMSTGDSLRALGSHVPGNELPGPAAPGGLPPFQHSLPPLPMPTTIPAAGIAALGANPTLEQVYGLNERLNPQAQPTTIPSAALAALGENPTLEQIVGLDRRLNPQDLEPKDEFNRNLKRLIKLEEEGKQNTTEYRELAKRIAKQNEGAGGIALQVGDDGSISFAQGPGAAEGLGAALTGQQAITQQDRLDRFDTTIDTINNVVGLLKEDTSRSGVTGSIRSFAQRVMGVANDATPTQIAEAAKVTISQMKGIPDEQRENISTFFDPALSELEIYQNTIALELAKMRVTSGGGGIRAMESAFRDARKDAAIFSQRGKMLFSTQEALTRYETILNEFSTERDKLKRRLVGGGGKPKVIQFDVQGNRIQ